MVVKKKKDFQKTLGRTPVMHYTSGIVLRELKVRNEFYYSLSNLILVYCHGVESTDLNGNAQL